VWRRLGANEQKVVVQLKFVGQSEGMVNNKTTGLLENLRARWLADASPS